MEEPCWNTGILRTQRQGYLQPRWYLVEMLRDFIPVLPYKYEPRQEWSILQEDRERAFAKKLYNDGTRLAMGTRKMPPPGVGDKVLVQNQTGRVPNKWDKSGGIVECKPHDQINVMMDGSRRESLRN